jgi:hypothetical protein
MIKVDLNFQIKTLDGSEMTGPGGHAGKNTADVLSKSVSGNSAKIMVWAYDLYKNGFVEIEKHEKEILINLIEGSQFLFAIAKDQIVKAIERSIEEKPSKK